MSWMKRFYRMVSSMRFGLALMGVCAAFLGAGAVLMKDGAADTAVFRILLVLVLVNMAGCAINQTAVFFRTRRFGEDRARRIRRLALISLHGGIVLILLGGAVNYFSGFGGKILLDQGETKDIAEISGGKCPYSLTLNAFRIEYNSDGTASQYYADVTLSDQTGDEERFVLSVNSPAVYKGTKIYYSQYFNLYILNTLTKDGRFQRVECWEGEYAALPEGIFTKLKPLAFDPGGASGEAPLVYHAVSSGDADERNLSAELGKWYDLEPGSFYQFSRVRPHVVLAVKAHPGNLLSAVGAFFVAAGTLAVFFRKEKKA